MLQSWPLPPKRIVAIAGHYGSGKTELAVSLAMLAARLRPFPRIALIDLDIANPYFRSRERRAMLEQADIFVSGSAFEQEITAELPALCAAAKGPLEDPGCLAIVDLGGNSEGAKVIRQFGQYFTGDAHEIIAVVNANRPDTGALEGAMEHLAAIEATMGLQITGLANNCHLLQETTWETVVKGSRLCKEVSEAARLPILLNCYPEKLVKKEALTAAGLSDETLMPLGMYMRPSWLDR